MRADKQHRRLGRQCGKDWRVEMRQAVDADAGEQPHRAAQRKIDLWGWRCRFADSFAIGGLFRHMTLLFTVPCTARAALDGKEQPTL